MAPLNILIVGCGIAGSTLASFLLLSNDVPATDKPRITILERAPSMRSQGQNIDIRGAGVTIIRKLGLENAIRAATTGEVGVKWVDAQGAVWAALGADRSGKMNTPTADIEILRGSLAELCWLRSRTISDGVKTDGGAGIEFMFGDYLDSIDQDGNQVHVQFAKSGQKRSYDLVVGADGLQSQVRRLAWGLEGETGRVKRLGAYGAFFSIPREPTDSDWRRWFHASRGRNVMLRPDQQHGKTTVHMFVVNEEDSRLREVGEKGREDLNAQKELLEEYFSDAGWEMKRVLAEMKKTDDFYYDMKAQIKMDKWSKGRVVLVGDAGYCASPFSGMGTTLALDGGYNLAGALTHHPNDPTAAFDEYEADMRPVVARAQKLFPGMPRIFAPQTEWGVWILNAIVYFIQISGLPKIMFNFLGPPANKVPVKDHGFSDLPEWSPSKGIVNVG